jgi:putative membrane protein
VAETKRWPGWVYDGGDEPDPRFSFANERTFLAWIRTSLALLAGGVALDALDLPIGGSTQHALALVMVVLGVLCAVASWTRWARAERAMRRGEPLPSSPFIAALTVGVMLVAVVLLLRGL